MGQRRQRLNGNKTRLLGVAPTRGQGAWYQGSRGCLLMLVAGTLLVAGCGGSSKSASNQSTPSGKTLSASALIAEADQICMRRNAEVTAQQPKSTAMPEVARLASTYATIQQAAVTELNHLAPPASLANEWKRLVAHRQMLVEQLLKLKQYAEHNDNAGIQAFSAESTKLKQQLLTSKGSGFTYCSVTE